MNPSSTKLRLLLLCLLLCSKISFIIAGQDTSYLDFGLSRQDYPDTQYFSFQIPKKNFNNHQNVSCDPIFTIENLPSVETNDSINIRYRIIFNQYYKGSSIHHDTLIFRFYFKKYVQQHVLIATSNVVQVNTGNGSFQLKNVTPYKVLFDSMEVHSDTVQEGNPLSFNIKIRNTDDLVLPLQIEKSCNCITTDLSTDSIAPGRYAYLKVIFKTDGIPGPFKKTIAVKILDIEYQLSFIGYIRQRKY